MKCFLFWLASWTWGIIMTFIGFVVALALLITGHKPQRFHYYVWFQVGHGWGGFSCGCFIFTSKDTTLHVKQHEAGHGLQNIMLGVFMPFIVAIPSMVRYWYRELYVKKKYSVLYSSLPNYDDFWVEGWATRLGEKYFN